MRQIAATGSNDDILKLTGPNTRQYDLKGRTVIPGLIHTHIHLNDEAESNYGGYVGFQGIRAYPIAWGAVRSVQDVLNQVSAIMTKYKFPAGEWIYFGSADGGNCIDHARALSRCGFAEVSSRSKKDRLYVSRREAWISLANDGS